MHFEWLHVHMQFAGWHVTWLLPAYNIAAVQCILGVLRYGKRSDCTIFTAFGSHVCQSACRSMISMFGRRDKQVFRVACAGLVERDTGCICLPTDRCISMQITVCTPG